MLRLINNRHKKKSSMNENFHLAFTTQRCKRVCVCVCCPRCKKPQQRSRKVYGSLSRIHLHATPNCNFALLKSIRASIGKRPQNRLGNASKTGNGRVGSTKSLSELEAGRGRQPDGLAAPLTPRPPPLRLPPASPLRLLQ